MMEISKFTFKSCVPLLAAVYMILSPALALSEDADSGLVLLRIRILDEPYKTYRIGQQFRLNVSPEDLDLAGSAKNLRIRLFRGDVDDLRNPEIRRFKTRDNCVLYASRCCRAREDNGALLIGNVEFSVDWLKFSEDKNLESQVYLLILENSDSDDDFIKLKPEDVDMYFDNAHPFKVEAPSDVDRGRALIVRDRQQKLLAETEKAILRIDKDTIPSPKCRAYIRTELDSKQFALLVPVPCNN